MTLSNMQANPMDFVTSRNYKSKKHPPYTFEEAKHFLTLMKEDKSFDYLYTPVLLAFLFAATREEVTALLDTDLHDENYSITIDKAYIVTKRGKVTTKQKTEHRNRIVYTDKFVFDEIRRYKKEHGLGMYPYLCCTKTGAQLQPGNLTARFSDFVKKHKLKYLTFHKIRNTFGNMCKRAGIDPDTAFRMFGHANYKTTVEHYNSADDYLIRKASATLSSKLFENENEKPLAKNDFSM